MKFIILVSNLKEISPSVFSWKKKIYKKNYEAILSKYDSAEKRYINYAYVLRNGVPGRFNIFFLIFTQILLNPPVSFSRRIRQYFYF
jgi:hypothetical protein